jgi:LmbE family N-acetylglucosaminyl deacetylase
MQKAVFAPLRPKRALGIAAHPDDLDFGAAGTMARWASEGVEVYYLIITDGSKGSSDRHIKAEDLIKIRQEEQKAAAKILGVKEVLFLNYEDGCLSCNLDVKRDVVRAIRKLRPDIVVTMDPTMTYVADRGFINHPDHRAAGQAALDAVFPLARDYLSFPELLAEGLEPHKTESVLLINLEKSNHVEDISKTIQKKMDALGAHKSQMQDLAATQKMMKEIAAETGARAGVSYAESFVRIDVN